MGHDGERAWIPRPIRNAITYLRASILNGTTPMDGLGPVSFYCLVQTHSAYDHGQVVDLSQSDDAYVAAVLIKVFFRSLPEPIFTEDIFPTTWKCPRPDGPGDDSVIQYIVVFCTLLDLFSVALLLT